MTDAAAPRLYTPEFLRACALHFTGAMSLALYLLFPLYVKALGGSETTIGFVLGVGTTASVSARPFVGVWLDRLGRRGILVGCGIANVLSYLPFPFLSGVGPALYVFTVLHDVVWGALFAAYFTYAADLVPPERRAEGIAMFGVAGMAANGLAPVVGERVIDAAGYPAFFGLAIAFGVVAVAFSLAVPRSRAKARHATPPRFRDLVGLARHPQLAPIMLATLLLGTAINAAFMFTAPFTRELGLARVGPFFAAYSAMSVVVRLLGRRTLDVLGAHRVAGPAFSVYAAGVIGLALLPALGPAHATLVLVACGAACGVGHGTLFPVLSALALSRGPATKQGAVIGLHTAAIDAGAVAGMPLCGLVADRLGYPTMWITMALACLAGLVLMTLDGRARRGEAA